MVVQMAEFVLTNNYFEFGQKVVHQRTSPKEPEGYVHLKVTF